MELPKSSLNGMFGQYNSYSIKDNNFTINQTIPFPTVFQSVIKMSSNEQAIENENLNWKIRESELAVYTLFDAIRACETKKREVIDYAKSLDTLSQLYELKKNAGEISTIDVSAITIKKMRQVAMLNTIENDLLNLKSQLKSVVGMKVDENFELNFSDKYDVILVEKMKDSLTQRHWKEKNVNLIQQKLILEKRYMLNQQLPEFNLGYFNQTLIGSIPPNSGPAAGADKRFQGVMFGVNVPLFWNGFHHKHKELSLQMEKNRLDFETSTKSFQINYKNLYYSYNNQFLLLENRRLLLSNEIENLKSQLELKKSNGDISNFELLQLNEELLEIELNFIETKQKTNEIGILINWINKILENENIK
jgi:cobalt-zinc-cadmium resistance protein CzcA